ncbi:MAG: serine/threonine protein kinase [Nocardia sp.]|nr:serine/threonine protein kinase [Nocardia sp.]
MAMSPGTIVGGYRIDRVLGAGGMGTVYLAKHPSLPRMDAIKVLSAELSSDPEFRGRFEREANLAAGLDHPNIVSVYNRGEENGQLWIAMQYVDGTDASAELVRDRHSMTPLRALRIVTEVGKGLDYAHRRALLHRDIKPANFLLSTHAGDDEERVLLADFGVAKSADDAAELTQTGSFVATIAYASPEQLQGQPLDNRADIYSLGCSFYKLLTGQNPYPANQPAMVMMGHLYEPPPRPTAITPGLSPALDQVIGRVLAKNPADRFRSCREFTDAAANALTPGHNPVRTSTSPTYPVQTFAPTQSFDQRPPTNPRAQMRPPAPPNNDLSQLMGPPQSKNRKPLILGAVAVVAVLAAVGIGVGIVATQGGSGSSTRTTTTAAESTPAPTSTAPITSVQQARAANPAFAGKTITMVDVTGGGDFTDVNLAVYLGGTPQTQFLEDLGFVYNLNYKANGNEPNPRPIAKEDSEAFTSQNDGYILALRSDKSAGGGGLLGLPYQLTNSRATIIPVDDPASVAAMRTWASNSQSTLLSKLVPILHQRVR